MNKPAGTSKVTSDQRSASRDAAVFKSAAQGDQARAKETASQADEQIAVDAETGDITNLTDAARQSVIDSMQERDLGAVVDEALGKIKSGIMDPSQKPVAAAGLKTIAQIIEREWGIDRNATLAGQPYYVEKLEPAVENIVDVSKRKAYLMVGARVDGPGMLSDLSELKAGLAVQEAVQPLSNAVNVFVGNLQFSLGNQVRTGFNAVTSLFPLNKDLEDALAPSEEYVKGPAQRGVDQRRNNANVSAGSAAAAAAGQAAPPAPGPAQNPGIQINLGQPATAAPPAVPGTTPAAPAHGHTGAVPGTTPATHGHKAGGAATDGGTARPAPRTASKKRK